MVIRNICYIVIILMLLVACSDERIPAQVNVKLIDTPSASSGQSRLVTSDSGKVYLSWIEYEESDSFEFMYAQLTENDSWDQPIRIAKGTDWFINWADFPSLAIYTNEQLAAHWLQMRDVGTYDYDVHIAQSKDGLLWSTSFIPHTDSLSAEHGFASMISLGDNLMVASWLDGRNTVALENDKSDEEPSDDEHGHGQGAMTLRTATFNQEGLLSNEFELDHMICDCCQTDMALTNNGPIVVYRDRSDDEIRDISIVRYIDNKWTSPSTVFNDEWQINGCPVNGPAVDAIGQNVVVAWYTASNGVPKVQLALSTDNGANFDLPIHIDNGNPLGRVDTKWLNHRQCIVTWLEAEKDSEATIQAKFVDLDGTSTTSFDLIKTKSSRKSGFPILTKDKKGILITWTELLKDHTVIRTARITT